MSNENKPSVLLVDDEPNVLSGYKRTLRREFEVFTAESGRQALEQLQTQDDIAVIVSDMRMPEMDGVQLLHTTRQTYPDVTRVMLTGNADQQTAVDAINEGDIFRFHTKPCSPEQLASTLRAGIEQHRLRRVEKDLLENTLKGAIEALVEVLSLVNPQAFGRSRRITELTRLVAKAIGLKDIWALETLATLSQVGCVILPGNILDKVSQGRKLNEEERQLFEMHPAMGADIIEKIPRMETIARNLRYQMKNYDGSGIPHNPTKERDIPTGARILRVITDFDDLLAGGASEQEAFSIMLEHRGRYDPQVLSKLQKVLGVRPAPVIHRISYAQLQLGMTIARDITTKDGVLVISAGQLVSKLLIERLNIFAHQRRLPDEVHVILAPEHE